MKCPTSWTSVSSGCEPTLLTVISSELAVFPRQAYSPILTVALVSRGGIDSSAPSVWRGLALHGSGEVRVKSGLHYIAINLAASSFFLIVELFQPTACLDRLHHPGQSVEETIHFHIERLLVVVSKTAL